MKNGTVTNIQAVNSSAFSISDAAGNSYTSRKVVLATGLKDILPSTPGIADEWARGIYWCPWCDGYEHRDQPLGLLGAIDKVFGLVTEIETLNTDLIVFTNGTMTPEGIQTLNAAQPNWQGLVKAYNLQVENRTITEIERIQDGGAVSNISIKTEYDKFLVHFDDGTTVERGAFFTNWPSVQASNVGTALGVQLQGNKLLTNITNMETNIPGVYAVGDANMDGSTNIPHAMWSGKRAGVEMHSKSHPPVPPTSTDQGPCRDDGRRGLCICISGCWVEQARSWDGKRHGTAAGVCWRGSGEIVEAVTTLDVLLEVDQCIVSSDLRMVPECHSGKI